MSEEGRERAKMFKTGRWRSEKNKVKFVFKLQFHATQVPQLGLGRDALIVSLVPIEAGKPTAKSEKAAVHDGTCRWENPIFETVKFTQEPRIGGVNEKIYQFTVSSGSSRAGFVGEVKINFADYADAIKPYFVSLPLTSFKSGAVLHVTIERMYGGLDQREENGDATTNIQDNSLRSKFSNSDTDGNINLSSMEDRFMDKTISATVESNGNVLACIVSDTTSGTGSDSSSGLDTPRELGFRKNSTHQDSTSFLSSLSHNPISQKPISDVFASNHLEHRRSNTEWSVGSAPDGSVDDLTNSSEDNLTNISVGKLKGDLVVLARQAEVSDLELQTLRKQIVKESRRGQDLLREVAGLKEERDAFRQECEQLKASHKHITEARFSSKLQFECEDPRAMLQEIRQELNHEKELNNNLRLQLQKTQESNSELILAVQDLDEMLEQKSRDHHLPFTTIAKELPKMVSKHEMHEEEEEIVLEELAESHNDAKEASFLKQKLIELSNEIDMYKRERDELEMQMEQLALDYEILKQENHELSSKLEHNHLQDQLTMQYEDSTSIDDQNEYESQVESLQRELKKREDDFSASVNTVNELKRQVENLKRELEKREKDFSASSNTVNKLKTQVESLEREIKKRKQDISASLTAVNELENQVQNLEREAKKREDDLTLSLGSVKEREIQVERLEGEIKKREEDFVSSLATVSEFKKEVASLRREIEKREDDFSASSNTVFELTSRVEILEREVKKREEDSLTALATINELESHTRVLEKELEEQAQLFEADLEILTNAKVEQEKRAIQAEESLRKTRWANANTAERLQEEFRKLSAQMASTFDANEKLAMKALTEANELRLEKIRLGEMIEKSNEELGLVKGQYEEKLKELSYKIDDETRKTERMLLELENKSKKLEHQKKLMEEMREVLTKDNLMLRVEVEKLNGEKHILSKKAEENVEGGELERKFHSARTEVDEKELTVRLLQSNMETLRAQYNELKQSLFEDEIEKENLRKQIFNLRADLQKKEDTIKVNEKKMKDISRRAITSDGAKPTLRSTKSALSLGSKEAAALRDKIQLLEGQIKLKEAALENSTNSFLEKEKDLCNRIEELGNRMVELDHESTSCCVDYNEKEVRVAENKSQVKTETYLSVPNGSQMTPIESNDGTHMEQKPIKSQCDTCDQGQLSDLLSEMGSMRAKNILMEDELKDMQERYSEISLKFAEVEGERQQLVMRVRYLKNAKKT
ncbi:hypothetical protein GIB67_003783 [Kingdonia uniflora]|uniref:C2 NT-type domain-containing protein n=1 Tax=Kingdonia uniflora TaxID=39325 RepID=A0A7J7M1H0_9MAGN|nr:hypothetical protein GIB67_003783 [Kingdonia uniflora]